ncbi:MAG: hypothetical protein GXP47_09980 [Acidobacteria bacterium]|nr:hypothetical protein [Acidobacteriota bacterium]
MPRPWLNRTAWRIRPPVLALGGGGARGFAHLGFLEAVERLGLPVGGIAGCSAGALMGGMYLAYGSVEAVLKRWNEAFERKLVNPVPAFGGADNDGEPEDHPLLRAARRIRDRVIITLAVNRSTVLEGEEFEEATEFLVPDISIEELPVPFVAVATDLASGAEVRLRTGSLRRAVMASSAIPSLVPPVEIDGRPLVDGGVVAEVPVGAARELGWPVVAVDISQELPPYRRDRLVLETMNRTQAMTSALLRACQLQDATAVVRPPVGPLVWSAWDHWEEMLEAGRKAARGFLGEPRDGDRPAGGAPASSGGVADPEVPVAGEES